MRGHFVLVHYFGTFSVLFLSATRSIGLHHVLEASTQLATLTLKICIPTYMSQAWLSRLKNIVRVSTLLYCIYVLAYGYS